MKKVAKMDDLISRQDAIDSIRKIKAMSGTADDEILLIDKAEAMMELMRMASAEPERKKGEWLCDSYCLIFKQKIWRCSVCGNLLDFEGVNAGRGDANYCPNCGADMRGQEV